MHAGAVGHEASWSDGGWWHEELRVQAPTFKARQRELTKQLDNGQRFCAWGGKRLLGLIMGRGAEIAERVKTKNSERYNAALLLADPTVRARVAGMRTESGEAFAQEVVSKTDYALHTPTIAAAPFGEFCGFSLSQCKERIRVGFEEFNNTPEAQRDPISIDFLVVKVPYPCNSLTTTEILTAASDNTKRRATRRLFGLSQTTTIKRPSVSTRW